MIAIGVLLALGAEGLAEHVHNRHLVREAKENILGEIRDNHETLQENLPKLASNEKLLKTTLESLGKLRSDRRLKTPDVALNFNMLILSDSSWKTAGTTGALGLMSYNEVKEFATDYDVQDTVNRLSAQLTDYWLSMTAMNGDASKLSDQQLDDLILRGQLCAVSFAGLGKHLQVARRGIRKTAESAIRNVPLQRLRPGRSGDVVGWIGERFTRRVSRFLPMIPRPADHVAPAIVPGDSRLIAENRPGAVG